MKNIYLVLLLIVGIGILGYMLTNRVDNSNEDFVYDDWGNYEDTNNFIPPQTTPVTSQPSATPIQTTPQPPVTQNPETPTSSGQDQASQTPSVPTTNAGGGQPGQSNCQAINTNTAYQLATNAGIYLEPGFGVSLVQSVDLTGDGIPECIFSGNGGNSGMAFILRNSTIVNQKDQNNIINPVQLLSVGRVMFSVGYDMLPQHNGYYTISKSLNDDSGSYSCSENGVNVYTWNNTTNLFEWNQGLTLSYTNSLCN